jgi:hypothetical protein
MIARPKLDPSQSLPSRGALCPSEDCRSIARFPAAGLRPFVNLISPAGLAIVPLESVYAGTKNAVCVISEGVRQEAGDRVRHFAGLRPNRACRLARQASR